MGIVLYFVMSYLVGGILFALLISRLFYDGQILRKGSGNPGSRNMGRVYGQPAFIGTFLGDAGKGALIVAIGKWFVYPDEVIVIALGITMLGHIFPFYHLKRGGEAVATFLGGIAWFDWRLLLLFVSIALLGLLMRQSATISGFIGFMSIVFGSFYLQGASVGLIIGILFIMLVLVYRWHPVEPVRETEDSTNCT